MSKTCEHMGHGGECLLALTIRGNNDHSKESIPSGAQYVAGMVLAVNTDMHVYICRPVTLNQDPSKVCDEFTEGRING